MGGKGTEGNIASEDGKDHSGHVTAEDAASWREQACGYLGAEPAKEEAGGSRCGWYEMA